jgi:hypothetical protein
LPLGTGITLESLLTKDHEINTVVRDPKVSTAGYQGTMVPNQWFGGPALSSNEGNMVLRDAVGNVADGLNYGGLVDPWAAEGYQAASGAGESGCFVPSPGPNRGFRMAPTTSTTQPNRSAGRFPDGADSDYNCRDFLLQSSITLLGATPAGSNNIKIGNVADFTVGQKVIIGSGANSETAVIKTIGTTGGTTVSTATQTGTKFIPVVSVEGFSAGQTITIDNGANIETAVVAATTGGRRRFFGFRGTAPVDTITLTSPLAKLHNVDAQVSGSGITFNAPLTKAQENGAQIANYLPTPGAPNQYFKKP